MQSSEELIRATHDSDCENFDTDLVFAVSESILKHATGIVDAIMSQEVPVDTFMENLEKSLSPLRCILTQLSSKMACDVPDESTADKLTMSILEEVSCYSWVAKAMLAFTAFALEYWNFWFALKHLSEVPKPVAILKRVPAILDPQKYRNVSELKRLIEATSEFIKHIVDFGKKTNHGKRVPNNPIPTHVYWAIRTSLACTTQMYCVIETENKTEELSVSVAKIKEILNSLKRDIEEYEKQEGEIKACKELKSRFRTSDEITEVIFNGVECLLDGSTEISVNIDVLKEKKLLLLISALDISTEEVSVLKLIYNDIMREEKYKIVWIPMVQLTTDFQLLQSKMPWYIVRGFKSSVRVNLIKKVTKLEKWPLLMVVNSKGKVEHPNALHVIHVWGMKAFPFTIKKEKKLLDKEDAMEAVLNDINSDINGWIKDKKYIFCYGGEISWNKQFYDKAISLKEKGKISAELLCIESKDKGKYVHGIGGRFWRAIQSLFFCKARKETKDDRLMFEIQKLLSYKNENGWAVLYKGSTIVSSGRGTIILEVFGEWEGDVPKKDFENCFLEDLQKFSKGEPCWHIDIPITAEVQHLNCAHCSSEMETYLGFKCCHEGVR